ncbi:MAG TPA: (2Fe-2S)-binding protein [Symbiobacteriaceae bacterium]|jgi:hypothetical protein
MESVANIPSIAATLAPSPEDGAASCPVCGNPGRKIKLWTVNAQVKLSRSSDVGSEEGYHLCVSRTCPAVYYHPGGGQVFRKDEIVSRVWYKETEEPIPACYCLNVSERRILEEVLVKQCCTSLVEIKQYTGANTGKECHLKNPQGRCCGGVVKKIAEYAGQFLADERLKEEAVQTSQAIPES